MSGRRIPLPAQVALAVAGALALAAGAWFFVVSPQRAKSADLAAEIASTQQEIEANQLARLQAEQVEPIEVADLFRLSKAMPDHADMSGVLLELNRIAADTGITFESISPQAAVPISGYQAVKTGNIVRSMLLHMGFNLLSAIALVLK